MSKVNNQNSRFVRLWTVVELYRVHAEIITASKTHEPFPQIYDVGRHERDMTKPTKRVCAQRRLRSACASAQSDQSLHCPHEEILGPWLSIERTAKTLIRVFAGRTLILLVLSCRGSLPSFKGRVLVNSVDPDYTPQSTV